jgi:hypothetical protein
MLNARNARYVAMVVLPGISFLFGNLPIVFPSQQGHPLLMSAFLCFGAGVLLAVSMLHMLPQAYDNLHDLAELSFCIGFLLLYFIDEITCLFCIYHPAIGKGQRKPSEFSYAASNLPSSLQRTEKQQQETLYDQSSHDSTNSCDSNGQVYEHGNRLNSKHPRRFSGGNVRQEPQNSEKAIVSSYSQLFYKTNRPSTCYGATGTTNSSTVGNDEAGISSRVQCTSALAVGPASLQQPDLESSSVMSAIQISQWMQDTFTSSCKYHMQQEQNETGFNVLCHTEYSPPYHKSRAGHVGLLIALTFQATLETVAVGNEPSAEQVLWLTGAIACHRLVVAFCYGLELRASGNGCLSVCGHIFLFSLGSELGIILGGLLAEDEQAPIITAPAVPITQVRDFSQFSVQNGILSQLSAVYFGFNLPVGTPKYDKSGCSSSNRHKNYIQWSLSNPDPQMV